MKSRSAHKHKIPRTNTAIILLCLGTTGTIVVAYPFTGRQVGIDLLGIIAILFVIVIGLLEHSGVRLTKALKVVRGFFNGKE